MLDRILLFLGLMRVEKARHFHRETVAFVTRAIGRDAVADFGVPIDPNAEPENRKRADIWFDEMLKVVDDPLPLILRGTWENE